MNLISLAQAVAKIRSGEVIAYPTEAVYGLGCDPFNHSAFERLLTLKQRPVEKGVILIAANLQQVLALAAIDDQPWTEVVVQSWADASQPVTWVLPATEKVPEWITGGRDTVAIRVTHHPIVKALCEQLGTALVSTSANLSGEPPIRSAQACDQSFAGIPILEGTLSGVESPSQIWDAQTLTRLR
ncbi:MAG: Sua5/YciO/YrdC/YwlC family protein [Hydrogenovibrio sp.]|nr:Sua5/YciO/YrdC/YwlC family protein [Hydrogenovibrio sp.]